MNCWGKELIANTTIELTLGRKYGLIGRNGSGKSEFLKVLANREVPIPDFVDIFMLTHEVEPEDKTAIEVAVSFMRKRAEKLEKEAEEALEKYGAESEIVDDLYCRIDELDPQTFESRASNLLRGLGFGAEMGTKKTKDMSGGWRMRVALAQALLVAPSLLLLDEPTNHLDLEACVWLENYLAKKFNRCLVVVSHSQDFLNNVCTNIIHITPLQTLKVYQGNYDTFVKTKEELEINQMKRYRKEQDDIKHIKDFVASCGTFSNLVRQGKSKLKILDKMKEKGLTEEVVKEHRSVFRFPDVEQLPTPTLAFYDVGFAYSGEEKDMLYTGLDLSVQMDSRIVIVGPNGSGKSTLLKLMVGEIQPTVGQVKPHLHLKLGRYHQHSNDALDGTLTPLEMIMKRHPENQDIEAWRQFLGKYGVSGKEQLIPISKLSDGQKSRIVFALLCDDTPHILLLDEPTNHLDMDAIDGLAEGIKSFNGGVVLVSHDFRLLEQVAKEIWLVDDRKVVIYKGGIRDYKNELARKMDSFL